METREHDQRDGRALDGDLDTSMTALTTGMQRMSKK